MKFKNLLSSILILLVVQVNVFGMGRSSFFDGASLRIYQELKEAVFEKLKETNPTFAERFVSQFKEPNMLSVLTLAQYIDELSSWEEIQEKWMRATAQVGEKEIELSRTVGSMIYNALDAEKLDLSDEDIKVYEELRQAVFEKNAETDPSFEKDFMTVHPKVNHLAIWILALHYSSYGSINSDTAVSADVILNIGMRRLCLTGKIAKEVLIAIQVAKVF